MRAQRTLRPLEVHARALTMRAAALAPEAKGAPAPLRAPVPLGRSCSIQPPPETVLRDWLGPQTVSAGARRPAAAGALFVRAVRGTFCGPARRCRQAAPTKDAAKQPNIGRKACGSRLHNGQIPGRPPSAPH